MEKTAVQWLVDELEKYELYSKISYRCLGEIEIALEMEKEQTDNKVIHFAEWITKKHSFTLMALYEHFEEEYYKEKLD